MLYPNYNCEWHFVLEAIPFTRESVSEKIQKYWLKLRGKYIPTNRIFNQLFYAWYLIKRNVVLIFSLDKFKP